MSNYLLQRLRHAANADIQTGSQVAELIGDERLSAVKIRDADGRVRQREPVTFETLRPLAITRCVYTIEPGNRRCYRSIGGNNV
jgi:hypothetical protein